MLNLTNEEKEFLLKAFEDSCSICLCDIIENLKEKNNNINKLYKKLDEYCDEYRMDDKSCSKCFKSFFNLFTEEKEIIF